MTPLDRLAQTARIHGHRVCWTQTPICVHVPSELAAMHYAGSTSDPDGDGNATCEGRAVRFVVPVRVPAQRVAIA